nr:MAG TPA: hypothetical protein [Bacteriophage sp.]
MFSEMGLLMLNFAIIIFHGGDCYIHFFIYLMIW